MKLLGVITLYHPSPRVAENLSSYVEGLDGLFVWDNTPTDAASSFTLPQAIAEKVVYTRQGDNVGIAQALNAAATYAEANGYTHLLTMDQDSDFQAGSFRRYRHAVEADSDASHMAYVPCINKTVEADNKAEEERTEENRPTNGPAEMEEVSGLIISGTIFPVETLRTVGHFLEALVIDAVDTEYALRIRRAQGRIMRIPSTVLHHELGYSLRKRFLCWHPVSLNYSPLRTYYIARNFLYLRRHYPEFRRPDLLWQLVWKRPFYILFLEEQKQAKLAALCRGIWQGLRGNLANDLYFHQLNPTKP